MKQFSTRRSILLGAAAFPLLSACAAWGGTTRADATAQRQLRLIETELDGRLGLFACATADGRRLDYRSDERFPLCSTFKLMLVAALLKMSEQQTGLLQQVLNYRASQLVEYSPITAKHVDAGMSVADLCAAALQYSDNTAGNLLIERLGGPAAVTEFARSLGEFGATITFVSNIPGETQTIPTAIYTYTNVPGGEPGAMRLAIISVAISMVALILSEILARRVAAKVRGDER